MSFTKITPEDLRSRGCTTLPDQPTISAQALKEEFDAPAKEVVAPKVNNLIDELEASTAAASIGAVPPTGMTGNNLQALIDELSEGGGGGGTTVVANPTDTATDELTKIKIGTATYSISEGRDTVDYHTTSQNTGIMYLDGSDIFQISVVFSSAVTLASDTWVNALQDNTIGGVVKVEGTNSNDETLVLKAKVSNGYVQVMNIRSVSETMKNVTIWYTKTLTSYIFDYEYQTGNTYSITSAANMDKFIKEFVFNTTRRSSWDAGCHDNAMSHISDIISFFHSRNVDNASGILLKFSAYGPGSHYYMLLQYSFYNPSGSYTISSTGTYSGYSYCGTNESHTPANNYGTICVYPNAIDYNYQKTDGLAGTNKQIGINYSDNWGTGCSIGVHYA